MTAGDITIMQIAMVAFIALAGGIFFSRLKQPPIVAYVLTGVIAGPSCLSLIESREQVRLLAELGVLLLLFVIGMELNIRTFKQHLFTSSAFVCLQVIVGLAASFIFSLFFDWPLFFTIALGFVTALSSTAVVVNTLDSMKMEKSSTGNLIIGILIAQDIAVVPMILILKALIGDDNSFGLFPKVIVSVAFMALFIYYLNQRSSSNFNPQKILGKNKDFYMLMSLSICFASATIAGGIGLTAPYGAFLAGLAIGNLSNDNNLFVESIKPIQNLLLMIFFLSIGILLDIQFVLENFLVVFLLLMTVTIIKTVANIYILKLLKLPLVQASFVGIALAQLGEFAFLLTTILEHVEDTKFIFAEKCLISLTVLSLAFSPIWFKLGKRINKLIKKDNTISVKALARYTVGYSFDIVKIKIISCFHYMRRKIYRIFYKNMKH